jgi:aminoglycoside 6'-N-acetyltransferase I
MAQPRRPADDRVRVRPARTGDLAAIVAQAVALWGGPASDHRPHMRAILAGKPSSTLPLVLFVAERRGRAIGFIEVGLRSHADGCDGARPVGFIEGWFVAARQRGRGIGRALMDAAEGWARAQGCVELASDTWSDNTSSEHAHGALGFEVVGRNVNFRKPLTPPRRR